MSALKDGKGVTLARDEFHERTASKDIQIIMPKQQTERNMQVLTQYVTYGATSRKSLLKELFCEHELSGFKLAKGCTRSWLNIQEKYVTIFNKMISAENPFKVQKRLLYQPFTSKVVKDCTRLDILGRNKFGEVRKDYGKEILISYVKPRFCQDVHNIDSEKIPMSKKILILFPSKKTARVLN